MKCPKKHYLLKVLAEGNCCDVKILVKYYLTDDRKWTVEENDLHFILFYFNIIFFFF